MKPLKHICTVVLCLGLIFGLAGGLWAADMQQKININTATDAQLGTLKGIGPALAQRIVTYREKNGAFKTVDDLANVKGIGPHKLAIIRDQITAEMPAPTTPDSAKGK